MVYRVPGGTVSAAGNTNDDSSNHGKTRGKKKAKPRKVKQRASRYMRWGTSSDPTRDLFAVAKEKEKVRGTGTRWKKLSSTSYKDRVARIKQDRNSKSALDFCLLCVKCATEQIGLSQIIFIEIASNRYLFWLYLLIFCILYSTLYCVWCGCRQLLLTLQPDLPLTFQSFRGDENSPKWHMFQLIRHQANAATVIQAAVRCRMARRRFLEHMRRKMWIGIIDVSN